MGYIDIYRISIERFVKTKINFVIEINNYQSVFRWPWGIFRRLIIFSKFMLIDNIVISKNLGLVLVKNLDILIYF